MMTLGLSHAELAAFEAGLVSDHKLRIRCDLLDMDHHIVGTASGRVVGGQVDWDTTAEVVRTASVQVHNPGDVLNLGTLVGPNSAAFYADRMIAVRYEVWSQQLPRWISVPVFTGPIQKVTTGDNDTVTIEASDKELLMQDKPNSAKLYPKGSVLTSNMIDLAHRAGEQFLSITPASTKSTKDYNATTAASVWRQLQAFAGGVPGRRLAYDAKGYLTFHPTSSEVTWVFRKGTGGSLLGQPKVTFDPTGVHNMVTVTGATPSGSKGVPSATVYAPASHPLNGNNIGRGGVPRWLRLSIQDDSITSGAAALARANAELAVALRVGAELDIDCLVIPHLEPWDVVRVDADTWTWSTGITKATIPLDGTSHMTIGRTYAVRNMLRPKVMPRKGKTWRAIVHQTTKLAPKKTTTKKTTTKKTTTKK